MKFEAGKFLIHLCLGRSLIKLYQKNQHNFFLNRRSRETRKEEGQYIRDLKKTLSYSIDTEKRLI